LGALNLLATYYGKNICVEAFYYIPQNALFLVDIITVKYKNIKYNLVIFKIDKGVPKKYVLNITSAKPL